MKIEMGIGWVPSKTSPGHVQSATPGEYAAEIERLRAVVLDLAEKANAGFRGDEDESEVLCYINNTARTALAANT